MTSLSGRISDHCNGHILRFIDIDGKEVVPRTADIRVGRDIPETASISTICSFLHNQRGVKRIPILPVAARALSENSTAAFTTHSRAAGLCLYSVSTGLCWKATPSIRGAGLSARTASGGPHNKKCQSLRDYIQMIQRRQQVIGRAGGGDGSSIGTDSSSSTPTHLIHILPADAVHVQHLLGSGALGGQSFWVPSADSLGKSVGVCISRESQLQKQRFCLRSSRPIVARNGVAAQPLEITPSTSESLDDALDSIISDSYSNEIDALVILQIQSATGGDSDYSDEFKASRLVDVDFGLRETMPSTGSLLSSILSVTALSLVGLIGYRIFNNQCGSLWKLCF